MADREDIIELINLYGFAMDTQRWDLFDRIFTEHCDADYGETSHWTNRAQFKADFGSFEMTFYIATQMAARQRASLTKSRSIAAASPAPARLGGPNCEK